MDSKIFNKLYYANAYDTEYNSLRKLKNGVKAIYNPVQQIINIDMGLILNEIKIEGADELFEYHNKENILNEIVFNQLKDYCYIDSVKYLDGKTYLMVLTSDEVTDVKKDMAGNIIGAKINYESNGITVKKEYYIEEGKRNIRVKYGEEGERNELFVFANVEGFPIVQIAGLSSEKKISRIEGILDKLDSVNKKDYDLENIFDIHKKPIGVGNISVDSTKLKDKLQKDEDEKAPTFLDLGIDGKLQYLELQGNIAKLEAEEKKTLKDEIKEEYPELMLSKMGKGQLLSGYAIYLSLLNLDSLIRDYRNKLKQGLKKILNTAMIMMGRSTEIKISFGEVIPESTEEEINKIKGIYSAGLLDLENSVRLIVKQLSKNHDFEENAVNTIIKRLKEESEYDNQIDQESEI